MRSRNSIDAEAQVVMARLGSLLHELDTIRQSSAMFDPSYPMVAALNPESSKSRWLLATAFGVSVLAEPALGKGELPNGPTSEIDGVLGNITEFDDSATWGPTAGSTRKRKAAHRLIPDLRNANRDTLPPFSPDECTNYFTAAGYGPE